MLFLQYRDQNESDARLRQAFRQAVHQAFSEPKRESGGEESVD